MSTVSLEAGCVAMAYSSDPNGTPRVEVWHGQRFLVDPEPEREREITAVRARIDALDQAAWITGSASHRREADRLRAWDRFLSGCL